MEVFFHDMAHEVAILAPKMGMGLLIFVAFWLAGALLRAFFRRLSQQADYNTAFILRLAGRTTSIALIVFGAITALGTMGINVSALVAGLGLTGFALGFALKDILSNLIAGVLILLYRPFRVNDYIMVAGLEGAVMEIDLRYTTLQKEEQKFLIPNSVLFTNSIGLVEHRKEQAPQERLAL
jgi:small-conductance mechanosensitive channel